MSPALKRVRTPFILALACVLFFYLVTHKFLGLTRGSYPDEENQVLQHADHCALVSVSSGFNRILGVLKPNANPAQAPKRKYLDGAFEELGRTDLMGPVARNVIQEFINAPDRLGGTYSCFDPHHALQIEANGHLYDFIICFECGQLLLYRDHVPAGTLVISGSPDLLNQVLTENNVPLRAD